LRIRFGSAVAVLDVGRDHRDAEKEADRIDDDIALDAFGLLSCVVSDRIPLTPPFSVAFTACVSMMAAKVLESVESVVILSVAAESEIGGCHMWSKEARINAGFKVVRRRWVIERTLSWLRRNRVAHYEAFALIAEGFAKLAMICVMLKRLTEPKPTCTM
jgi:transposase